MCTIAGCSTAAYLLLQAESGTQDSIIIILQIIYKGIVGCRIFNGSAELCIEINGGRKSKDYLCDGGAAADEFHGPWAAKVYSVPGSKKAADSLNILGQLRLL